MDFITSFYPLYSILFPMKRGKTSAELKYAAVRRVIKELLINFNKFPFMSMSKLVGFI